MKTLYVAPVRVPVCTLITSGGLHPQHDSSQVDKSRGTGKRTEMRLCFPTAVQSPLPSRGQAPFAHHGISGSSILSAVQRSASPVGLAPTSRIPIFFFSCTNKSKNSALICTDGGTRTTTHLGFLRDGCGNSTTLIPKLAALCQLHRYHPRPSSFRSVFPVQA